MRQQIDSHPPPLPPVEEEMHTKPSQHALVYTDEVSYVTLTLSCGLLFVLNVMIIHSLCYGFYTFRGLAEFAVVINLQLHLHVTISNVLFILILCTCIFYDMIHCNAL